MAAGYYTPSEVEALMEASPSALVIDVRGPDEFAAGHIPGARHIPHDQLEAELDALPGDRPLVPY